MVKRKQKTNVDNVDYLSLIPTRSSLLKNKPKTDFNVTVFESYKPKPKKNNSLEDDSSNKNSTESIDERKEIDMKRARFEVMKFGMSGFDTKKKEEAKVQLAISLGAKPPKNKCKNYKELLAEKKKNEAILEKQKKMQQLGKNNFGASTAKGKSFDRKRRKERGGLLEVYGTVKNKLGPRRRKF